MLKNIPPLVTALLLLSMTGWSQPATAAKRNSRGAAVTDVFEIAKQLEIAPMTRPSWASPGQTPIFRVAWMSDLHIIDQESIDLVTAACHAIRDVLKPNFTMITGDNCAYDQGLDDAAKRLPQPHRRQLWLKQFLDRELASPYCIIPGDNWPWDFDQVFGPHHYSFDFGGIHFQFAATDIQAVGTEGCAVFSPEAWSWMRQDLQQNAGKPTLFILHETLWPATFLDAEQTAAMLNANPHVLAVLSGHLHLDLEFTRGAWKQFIAPAIGRSHRPAFKVISLFPDMLLLESHEWNAEAKAFQQAPKWQKIDLPEHLRAGLSPKPLAGFDPENRTEMPAAPKQRDDTLNRRAGELSASMMTFILNVGMDKLFGP